MLLLRLDPAARAPLYRQIAQQIAARIDSGALQPGEALTPSRTLAMQLGVNRSTVCRAYAELQACGHLESRAGGYSCVRQRPANLVAARRDAGAIDWAARILEPAAGDPLGGTPAAGDIDFRPLGPDPRLAPLDEIRRGVRQALASEAPALLDYCDPRGHAPLRGLITERMKRLGAALDSSAVLLCNGAQHGLDLIFRCLLGPGAAVVVEAPGYSCLLPLLARHGAEPVGIPMREDGMDLDALERLLSHRKPAALYTMPNFQNPTGITTGVAHRERLLGICARHALPVIEDGFSEDMKYFGRAVPPLLALDNQAVVIHVGTFSKLLFPGLRVGWLAGPQALIDALGRLRSDVELGGSALAQATLWQFCRSGALDRHLRRLHTTYRRRMQCLLRSARIRLPDRGLRLSRPQGGYVSWLELESAPQNEARLFSEFARAGVWLTPGSASYPGTMRPAGCAFRLSIAQLDEAQIDTGLQRIAAVLRTQA